MSLDWTALSDAELAALSLSGQQAAFAEIMRRHREPIFRLLRGFCGGQDEALDLLQETFVAAHLAMKRYDSDRSMRIWLSTIALNKCRDWARRRMVRRILSFALPIGAEAEAVAEDCVSADRIAADRQELERTIKAIADLPRSLKEPLILRAIEGLSQAETADILSISEKAVEMRVYRARKILLHGLGVR